MRDIPGDFRNTTIDWETLTGAQEQVSQVYGTVESEWNAIPDRWQDSSLHQEGCREEIGGEEVPDAVRDRTCFEDPRCHPEVPNENLCPFLPAQPKGATPLALDGTAAWFDYFTKTPNNNGPQNFEGMAYIGIRIQSIDQRAKMGAFLESAGWIARFNMDGDNYTIGTYRWKPCVRDTNCADPATLAQQPWIACKNGAPQPVTPQVNAVLQYAAEEGIVMYAVDPGLVGRPTQGSVVSDFRFEIRRFPNEEGFECPVGGTLIDRIPDAGGGACQVASVGCFPPPPKPPTVPDRAINVDAPSFKSFVQRSVDHDRETSVDVEVENAGDFPEVVHVRAEGPPGWEVSVSPDRFPLTRPGHGGAKRDVSVSVSPPDTADPDQVAWFRLFAETESGEEDEGSFPVQVVPRREDQEIAAASISVSESSLEALPGQPVQFIMELSNNLDEPQTVSLQVSSPMQDWAEIQAPGGDKVRLEPGETKVVYLVVTPPADAAPGQAAQFRLSAKPSAGDAVSTQVELTTASGGEVAGSSSLQEDAGAMMTAMGLSALAPSGIFGLLLLVLLILVILLLLFGRREREVVQVEEAEEPDE